MDSGLMKPKAKERVHCFDEATGKPLWTFSYDVAYPEWAFTDKQEYGPVATPAVQDGRVFTLGASGHVYCLDACKGSVLWKKDLDRQYEVRVLECRASPLIEGNLVIFLISVKSGASVIALEKTSGKEVWSAVDERATNSSPVVISAVGKKQLIVWTTDSVSSIDPATGKTYWRERLVTGVDYAVSTPIYHQNLLLIGGLMLELDAAKPGASVLWPNTRAVSRRILSNTSTALFRGEHLYSARSSGELVCLEARTGKQVWETDKVTDLKGGASIHLTSNGDSVFLYTDKGELIRAQLTPKGYKEISRTRLLEPTYLYSGRKVAWSPPAYANGHVFARSEKELVCASLIAKP
jgi:outer membrane protein assembly factor BamB